MMMLMGRSDVMAVTNHMLRQKIAEINRKTRYIHTDGKQGTALDDEGTVLVYETTTSKVKDNMFILDNGKRARLYNPCPGVYWKCIGKARTDGVVVLSNPLGVLVLDDGDSLYVLGVSGSCPEFEVRLQVGDSEVRLNNEFLNIVSGHVIRNGIEEQ
jgi:hypothetical protein